LFIRVLAVLLLLIPLACPSGTPGRRSKILESDKRQPKRLKVSEKGQGKGEGKGR